MASESNRAQISDEERKADGRVDAISAVVLVAIAVLTAMVWISGQ